LHPARLRRTNKRMKPKEKLAKSGEGAWTRAEDYLGALARKRSFRRAHQSPERTQPEAPRMMLSTLPFLALLVLMAVLSIGIIIIAYPGNQPRPRPKEVAARERGVANRGWFQEAQKEMHR
jgi:hypothetical protein